MGGRRERWRGGGMACDGVIWRGEASRQSTLSVQVGATKWRSVVAGWADVCARDEGAAGVATGVWMWQRGWAEGFSGFGDGTRCAKGCGSGSVSGVGFSVGFKEVVSVMGFGFRELGFRDFSIRELGSVGDGDGYSLRYHHQSKVEERLSSIEKAMTSNHHVEHEEIKKIVNSGNVSSAACVATAGATLILGYGLGWRGGKWNANRKFRKEQMKLLGQIKPSRWEALQRRLARSRTSDSAHRTPEVLQGVDTAQFGDLDELPHPDMNAAPPPVQPSLCALLAFFFKLYYCESSTFQPLYMYVPSTSRIRPTASNRRLH
ncbi:triacylglycerol lipase 2-like protein isoform X2 [Cinnamomum micranthum f. kanehirae]|uniref:Triacylglycerol lipase 2-like protein isoform X2 n=1 Tax=Cinnamomum micranthum f. kanehirae TaxID=337451 RepID=A0A443NNK6_9MAGN|nr:triacylglycerol lipase 2-like protein isoform X2 [Cinnamomum micranthum f. kanehirae]